MPSFWGRHLSLWFAAIMSTGLAGIAQTNFSIYSDQLNNNFQNWSWGANNFSTTTNVHSGSDAISLSGVAWQAISFWHSDFNPAPYTNLSFWLCGGPNGGQAVQIYLEYSNYSRSTPAYPLPALAGNNTWRKFFIPFAALGAAGITNLSRWDFELTPAGTTNTLFLDDVNLAAIPPSPVHLSVDANQTIRAAEGRWFGLNTAVWDSYFDTPTTSAALTGLGTQLLRFPGGSLSDEYHWASDTSGTNTWTWSTSFKNFIHIATNVGVQAVITVNYGTGTSNEAAAWVKCANLTNHLGFKYWEVGNECYGTWETDSNSLPHDPYTYATRAAQYLAAMKAADPADKIKIGVVAVTGEDSYSNNATHFAVNPRTGAVHYGWTPVLLATLKTLGVSPDFIIYHFYPEYDADNDQSLLMDSANWVPDAADLRQQIGDYLGTAGTNVEILCTENNSDAGNQGRQSTSIVNGLYLADSLARLMTTEINSFIWWDLRNGQDSSGDFDPSLYGWRTYGDLGIIGNLNTYYPTFYVFQLMQYFAAPGDTVLTAASDYPLLPVYGARKADGALALLVINKDDATAFTPQLSLANYLPWTNVWVRSFGMAQDEATRTNSPVPGAQLIATNTLAIAGTNVAATFPPYSVSLLTIPPAAPAVHVLPAVQGRFILQIQGQPKVRYVLQTGTNLNLWTPVATNTLGGTVWNVTNRVSAPAQFWRAVWQP